MKSSNSEAEIQSTTPCVVNQQTERHDLQNLLQKELSTISERTEHSSSANCLATIAGSTVNTSFTVPSPQITNANSNSRLTSLVTKSVRHQNPNFLDMTSTTIAGSGGNISATCGSSEYLVGNTTTVSSASTALKQGMSRAHSSYTPPKPARNPNDYDNAGNNTGGEGANAAAGRYIKNATRKSFKNSKSNDGGGGSDSNGERGGGGGLKAVYDYNNSILKEHFRNIDMKPDQGNQVNAQNTTTFVDRAGDTYGRNSNNVGHHDDDDDDRNEEEDEVDEVSDDSDCESEVDQNEEEEEYQPKLTRTPYSPSSIIMDSHQPDFAPPMEHNFNPNHCNDCMQKFLEQQLIAKDYEHQQQQQQQMSHEYSSQEDILSSLRGCVESPSMELSEAIYLNEFEMSKREDEPLSAAASNANARFSRGGAAVSEASRPSVISQSTENLRKSFYSSFDRRTSSKKKASDSTEHLLSSHSNSHYMNLTSSAKAPGAAETVRSSKSHSSLAASSTKPSPTSKKTPVDDRSSPSTNSIMATTPATAKLGNVRLDKHIIDMSKYKDYIYKLETRSDVSNQYFIKSLLTNEQTGHSLVLSQTKVKTPKMLTKLIIDQ